MTVAQASQARATHREALRLAEWSTNRYGGCDCPPPATPWYPGREPKSKDWRGFLTFTRDFRGKRFEFWRRFGLRTTGYDPSMLVEVVQLRATGMKLTSEEVAEAPRHRGNLTVTKDRTAYLHLGDTHTLNHVLNPMVDVRPVTLLGDDFLQAGRQYRSYGRLTDMDRQAWWCRALRADHLPPAPLFRPSG